MLLPGVDQKLSGVLACVFNILVVAAVTPPPQQQLVDYSCRIVAGPMEGRHATRLSAEGERLLPTSEEASLRPEHDLLLGPRT